MTARSSVVCISNFRSALAFERNMCAFPESKIAYAAQAAS